MDKEIIFILQEKTDDNFIDTHHLYKFRAQAKFALKGFREAATANKSISIFRLIKQTREPYYG